LERPATSRLQPNLWPLSRSNKDSYLTALLEPRGLARKQVNHTVV
jgi:hypothetical protein